MRTKIFITSLLLLIAFSSEGHKGHSHGTSKQKQLMRDLLNQAAALVPELLHPSQSLAHPYITPGGQRIYWDNAGSDMIRNMNTLYRHKLQNSCPFAIDAGVLSGTPPARVARGILSFHIQPFVEGGAMKVSEIGSEYGATAAVLKGFAEAGETAIALSTPLKGMHLVCEPIDIVIFFLVRKAQIYGRVFMNSPMLEQNRFAALLRLVWIRRKMIKGLKEVLIQLESDKINYEGLESVNREGRKNNRKRYIQTVSLRVSELFFQIREIDSRLKWGGEPLSQKERNKLMVKKDKLYRKVAETAAVSRKDFFAPWYSRYATSLFLVSRKGKKTHLKGHTLPDQLTAHHWLWPLQVQHVWDESLIQQATEEMEAGLWPPMKEDDIRRGLAEEFYDNLPEHLRSPNREEHIQSIEYMLGDIERIFDPSLSVEKRHFLAFQIEMHLTGLFEGLIRTIRDETAKHFNSQGWLRRLWNKMRLSWKLHRFARYSHIYADFLFTASLAKDKAALTSYKYKAMENFLGFKEYLHKLDGIAHSVKTAPDIFATLDQHIHPIQASQISKRKRTTFSFIPFKKPKPPLCRDLVREIQ